MIDYQNVFHVGVRVPDIDVAMAELGTNMGVTWAERRENPAQTLWTPQLGLQQLHLKYTYSAEGPQHIELLEGPAGSFWDGRNDAGAHHLGVWVQSVAEETDQLVGYNMGADDYVTKPFSNKVLLQKIKVLLRRVESPVETGDLIEHLGIRIDRIRHRVTVHNDEISLTPTEFKLLECMLRQPGRAFNRHQLMDAAIGEGQIVLERTIDVHVKTLRKKLDDAGGTTDMIETVRGVGYRFQEDPAKPAE